MKSGIKNFHATRGLADYGVDSGLFFGESFNLIQLALAQGREPGAKALGPAPDNRRLGTVGLRQSGQGEIEGDLLIDGKGRIGFDEHTEGIDVQNKPGIDRSPNLVVDTD